ncbi:response regulator [Hespellia stercorisuis]|uniref:Stage 0 sporulation protein A homolog n=1 Tax=Hespellia stercorisuis DSM 15480 TaxID=1121950 RepID=A0A1M6JDK1_9FIRM|nr:response regulator [Hespellia stercorisuis]SHJ44775.1 two-component system, response regulator YcbB [Hespellia stercorisuis DSM 15480]
MRILLIDDDKSILNILKLIITDKELGTVCGAYQNGNDAFEDLPDLRPDIIMVDLLMPEIDGISLVKKIKPLYPDIAFIMLSQVSSKDMIAKAYEFGIEFYIQKPINGIEVVSILTKVIQSVTMNQTFRQLQSLMTPVSAPAAPAASQTESDDQGHIKKVQQILQRLGLLGDNGSKDIIALVDYLVVNSEHVGDSTLHDLCSHFSDSPKSVEQRIRRAANAGMVNLANLGIEDYSNDTFIEYASSLYNFEQVKKEMDYIRGKSDRHGNVKVKNFLNSLVAFSKN